MNEHIKSLAVKKAVFTIIDKAIKDTTTDIEDYKNAIESHAEKVEVQGDWHHRRAQECEWERDVLIDALNEFVAIVDGAIL